MKTKYFIFFLILVTICVALLSACRERVTDVTLNKTELTLVSGETETLMVTIYPNDAMNKEVVWKSSNPAVATVNDNGLVTAITNGKTTITVTTQDGKKTAECFVSVRDYRARWVGSYEGEYTHYFSSMGGDWDDTIQGDVINVSLWSDSCLLIKRDKSMSWTPIVNIDGYFNQYDTGSAGYPMCNGNVLNDSISFSGILSASPGHTSSYNYKGKKL